MSESGLSGPEKLSSDHELSGFDSGEPTLDDWLRRRALQNEGRGGSRTYTVCDGRRVAGYYSLAAGAVAHSQASGRIKRNMPDLDPGDGIGQAGGRPVVSRQSSGLLRDALLRTLRAAEIVGIRAVLVHAISDDAKRFYEARGFRASPGDPMTLMITPAEVERVLAGSRPGSDKFVTWPPPNNHSPGIHPGVWSFYICGRGRAMVEVGR